MRARSINSLGLAAALALCGAAGAAETQYTVPVPAVETGMHVRAIRAWDFHPRTGTLVTASDDKTVRVWRYSTFRLLNTLRLPSGPGAVGRPLSVSLHPQGRLVAIAARIAAPSGSAVGVYVYDLETGAVVRTVTETASSSALVAFTPAGDGLAVAINAARAGLWLFRTSDFAAVRSERDAGTRVVDLKVAASGRIVTASDSGQVRVYTLALEPLHTHSLGGGGRPATIAISGDGTRVAVGSADRPRIEVFALDGLRSLHLSDVSGLEARPPFASLAWVPGGETLYAAEAWTGVIYRFGQGGRVREAMLPPVGETVTHVGAIGENLLAFTDPAGFRVLGAQGQTLAAISPPILDFRDIGDALRLGRDGEVVQYARARGGRGPAAFSVQLAQPVNEQVAPAPLSPAASALASGLGDWKRTGVARLRGAPLAMDAGERVLSVAVAPDAKRLFVGTDWSLRGYDSGGRALWTIPADAAVLGLAVAPEAELLVAAFGDGTLRWYTAADGGERIALFPHKNGTDWILWNPSGYYVSSPFGDNFVGWHVNNQRGQAPSFYRAVQFERTVYRPDILGCTVRCFGLRKKWAPDKGEAEGVAYVSNFRPPRIQIERIEEVQSASGGPQHRVRFKVDGLGVPLTDYSVYVNNVPVVPFRERLLKEPAIAFEREHAVTLPQRENLIRVEAFNGRSMGFVERVVEVERPAAERRGNLHIVAVGINQFPNLPKQFQLDFAVRDAEAVVQFFQAQARRSFDNVTVRLITDTSAQKPDRDTIIRELAAFSEAAGNDTVVLFLSSHAISDKAGNYFFAPREVRPEDLTAIEKGTAEGEASMIAWVRFMEALRTAAGKRVMIVDTCHAAAIKGKTDLAALQKRSAASRFAILSASRSDEVSMEYAAGKHGLFTYAMLQGLGGAADRDRDRAITLQELFDYVVPAVERLRPDKRISQTPQLVAPDPLQASVFTRLSP
jgi:WD40 repeat protein